MKTTTFAAAAVAAMLLGGCLTGRIDPPAGYLRIETGPRYDHRFLSVEHNVLATRLLANPEGGDLEYWQRAIEKELTELAGYTLKDSKPIKAGGVEGRLFDFRTTIAAVEQTYLVAVFVRGDRIALVEAGGQSDKVAADRDKLVKAMESLR